MIKRIADERARIDAYKFKVRAAQFFNDRQYHEDLEWLILSYLAEALFSSRLGIARVCRKAPTSHAGLPNLSASDVWVLVD